VELARGLYAPGQSPEAMQADYEQERAFWNESLLPVASRESRVVETATGPVPVQIFRMGEAPGPAIVYMHGGSFTVGSTKTHECVLTRLANYTGASVLSIDYHLAPAVHFPTPLDECQTVLLDIKERSEAWGVDPQHLALAGDSCGASMAAALYLRLRDQGLLDTTWHIDALLLAYGAYGLRDSLSRRLYGTEADGMTLADFIAGFQLYYRDPLDLFDLDTDILANDLSQGFAPAYLCVGSLDPLLDDSKALAAILEGHGLPYQLDIYPGLVHCFWQHARLLPQAEESLRRAGDFFLAQGAGRD
jgi:acetyl esterase